MAQVILGGVGRAVGGPLGSAIGSALCAQVDRRSGRWSLRGRWVRGLAGCRCRAPPRGRLYRRLSGGFVSSAR